MGRDETQNLPGIDRATAGLAQVFRGFCDLAANHARGDGSVGPWCRVMVDLVAVHLVAVGLLESREHQGKSVLAARVVGCAAQSPDAPECNHIKPVFDLIAGWIPIDRVPAATTFDLYRADDPGLTELTVDVTRALAALGLRQPMMSFVPSGQGRVGSILLGAIKVGKSAATTTATAATATPVVSPLDGKPLTRSRAIQFLHAAHLAVHDRLAPEPGSPAEVRTLLTKAEQRTLKLLLTGASEKMIARTLGCSHHTVHANVKRIYRRFHVGSRAELLARMLG